MRIAIVLPTLNDAETLLGTLQSIQSQTRPPDRVLIVDGGSIDGSNRIGGSFGIAPLVAKGCGRGGQIAVGTRVCTEDIIVVAHADMLFPPNALETLQRFLMRRPHCPGGSFGHRFDNPRTIYRAIEWFDRRRAIRGNSYGDQAQFFRREALESVGGFPALPLMEDVELSRRMRLLGRAAYLDLPVTVSARRYEKLGWAQVTWRNWRLRRLYRRDGEAASWQLYREYYGQLE